MATIILASTSVYKKNLFSKLGIPFEMHDPKVDESVFKSKIVDLQDLSQRLALEKARAIYSADTQMMTIGADQVLALGERAFEKPGNLENAQKQLLELQGKTHQLITSVAILGNQVEWVYSEKAFLTMRPLSSSQISKYLQKDRPFDCCGSYKLEESGISLFSQIQCSDQSSIVGLPLISISNKLNELGIKIPAL